MPFLKISLLTFFHPVRGFTLIKDTRYKSAVYFAPVILLPLCIGVKLLTIFFTNFPLSAYNPNNINIIQEMAGLLLPIFSVAVGVYLITTISDGEVHFSEMLAAMSFSLLPYIVFTTVLTAASWIMSLSSYSFFSFITTVIWIWVYSLFFVSICVMNTYKFFQTLKIVIIGILTAIFIWVVIALIFILAQQAINFLSEVVTQNIRYFTE